MKFATGPPSVLLPELVMFVVIGTDIVSRYFSVTIISSNESVDDGNVIDITQPEKATNAQARACSLILPD